MRKLLTIIAILFLQTGFCYSQAALEYFHTGANFYVKANFPQAEQVVHEGLLKFPDDPQLQALAAKLEEQKKQNQQQQQQQQQQAQQDKKQEQKKKENQQNQKEDQEKQQQQVKPKDKDQMSKEEAERILKALQEQEDDAQKKKAPIRGDGKYTDKDW